MAGLSFRRTGFNPRPDHVRFVVNTAAPGQGFLPALPCSHFVCRSGPLDTLMMFTTTIRLSNMYSTNIVVIIPIIWLYITVVVVIISFSIMVSCTFISLLLVTVGIIYSRMGSSISVIVNILFDGENISFEARLKFQITVLLMSFEMLV